jgi:phosphoglycolate phosphatase
MSENGKEVLMNKQSPSVIFDLDGTLADTSGDLIVAANHCFKAMGHGALLNAKNDATTALRGGRAMLRLGLTRVDAVSEATVDQFYPILLQAYASAIAEYTTLFPAVRTCIGRLIEGGYKIGICTNKPEALAQKLMVDLKFRDEFGSLVGADTLQVRKPDPKPFFEAVRRVGGVPERACLIGDSVTDHDTARAAGVPSILVDFGLSDQDIAALKPDVLITHFDQLEAALVQVGLKP